MTTDAGRPVGDNQNSLTVGPAGRLSLKISCCLKRWRTSTGREIPERVVHAKGSGAHGHFVCTSKEITKYTTAKLFRRWARGRRPSCAAPRWVVRRVRRTRSAIRAGLR